MDVSRPPGVDTGAARVLGRRQCLGLLASVRIGRVVYTDRALPAVMPVHFLLDDGQVTFHLADGFAAAEAIHGAVVTFQADHFDPVTLSGWSVSATGHARVAGLRDTPSLGAGPGEAALVRVPTRHLRGRRLTLVARA